LISHWTRSLARAQENPGSIHEKIQNSVSFLSAELLSEKRPMHVICVTDAAGPERHVPGAVPRDPLELGTDERGDALT
jgi:hypothetical protein